jgi:hypothetical protein
MGYDVVAASETSKICRTCHTSHATRYTSPATRHTSHITHHMSHVTRHKSQVTSHTRSLWQTSGCPQTTPEESRRNQAARRTLCLRSASTPGAPLLSRPARTRVRARSRAGKSKCGNGMRTPGERFTWATTRAWPASAASSMRKTRAVMCAQDDEMKNWPSMAASNSSSSCCFCCCFCCAPASSSSDSLASAANELRARLLPAKVGAAALPFAKRHRVTSGMRSSLGPALAEVPPTCSRSSVWLLVATLSPKTAPGCIAANDARDFLMQKRKPP